MTTQHSSFLATSRGRLTLLLLCAVQFLDVADSSIMNVSLPSIRRDLGFSAQSLQWVLSGYLVTYGGLLLLGGRAGAALTGGFQRALLACAIFLLAAAAIALRATNTRSEPTTYPSPAAHPMPAPELTD